MCQMGVNCLEKQHLHWLSMYNLGWRQFSIRRNKILTTGRLLLIYRTHLCKTKLEISFRELRLLRDCDLVDTYENRKFQDNHKFSYLINFAERYKFLQMY